jgi:hypothetical protein
MELHRWKNGVLNTLAMLMLAPTLGACASMKTVEWTEDVKLSDGRTIVVQRFEEYRRVMDVGAGFERGWLFQKSGIVVELPSPVSRKAVWKGTLIPLVLDVQSGNEFYLVGVIATGHGQFEWKVPAHEFYVVFQWINDGWHRIPFADLPRSVKPNLLASTYTLFIQQQERSGIHVDLTMKAKLDSRPTLDRRFKEILRLKGPAADRGLTTATHGFNEKSS